MNNLNNQNRYAKTKRQVGAIAGLLCAALVCMSAFASAADSAPSWPTISHDKGSFIQEKYLKVLTRPFVTRGIYQFHDTDGLTWRTEHPVTTELQINTKGLTEIKADGSSKSLTADTYFSKLLLAIFSSDQKYLLEQFSVTSDDKKLQLIPKDPQIKKFVNNIQLILAAEEIKEIEFFEPSGDRTKIMLSYSSPDQAGN